MLDRDNRTLWHKAKIVSRTPENLRQYTHTTLSTEMTYPLLRNNILTYNILPEFEFLPFFLPRFPLTPLCVKVMGGVGVPIIEYNDTYIIEA
jgi:hypothetical protein